MVPGLDADVLPAPRASSTFPPLPNERVFALELRIVAAQRKGLGVVICILCLYYSTGGGSRCCGDVNDEEGASEPDKDFADHFI